MDDFILPLADSWRFFKQHWLAICSLLLPFAVPLDILSTAASQFALHDEAYRHAPAMVNILEALLYPIFQGALILYVAETIRGQHHSNGEYYRRALQFWLPLFLVYIVSALAMIVGFMLFIIPGFIILSRLAFAEFYCLFDRTTSTVALNTSWQKTRPQQWLLFKGIVSIFILIMLPLLTVEYLLNTLGLWQPSFAAITAIIASMLSSLFIIFAFRVFTDEQTLTS
ncbi:hypothetical protein EDC56_0883 [Sinobacterium caligoides]|uniref:Glycerophosphoryl diester phosphodiesterase membrane domain-containing protein n=1 Tax=Sinobacterium caligoides TaxID=933926 RepID=A0A3N2DZQ4_9GAMM|nr:hypothetical protein [Sinobacterium caligoides]ROS05353.1 hypothetical protein EDC56_0883 [Sinobacterium caligoides]